MAFAARLTRLANVTVRVKEWQGEVVFLHEVVAGAADRSYGIQVAKLAGLPESNREMIRLRIEGYEIAEIAVRTGRSRRTVERVLQDFRNRIAPY